MRYQTEINVGRDIAFEIMGKLSNIPGTEDLRLQDGKLSIVGEGNNVQIEAVANVVRETLASHGSDQKCHIFMGETTINQCIGISRNGTVTVSLEEVMQLANSRLADMEKPDKSMNYQEWMEYLGKGVYSLFDVPKNLINKEMCWEAIRGNSGNLKWVPENLIDREICLATVRRDGNMLGFVPKELKNREMCLAAVKQSGLALGFVPIQLKDREICMEAVSRFAEAIHAVPDELVDPDICLLAIATVEKNYKNNNEDRQYHLGNVMKAIPFHFKDSNGKLLSREEMDKVLAERKTAAEKGPEYQKWVDKLYNDGISIADVPVEFRDRDMCWEAIGKAPLNLKSVPEEFRDRHICLSAVDDDGMALEFVPEELKDRDMCLNAVESDGCALKFVPEPIRDDEICLTAVRSANNNEANGYYGKNELVDRVMKHIPDFFKDKDGKLLPKNEMTEIWENRIREKVREYNTLDAFLEAKSKLENADMYALYDLATYNTNFLSQVSDSDLRELISHAPAILELCQENNVEHETLARIMDKEMVRKVVDSGYEYSVGYIPLECFDRETIEVALNNTHHMSDGDWYDNWGWNEDHRNRIIERCNELGADLLEKIPPEFVQEWENSKAGPSM